MAKFKFRFESVEKVKLSLEKKVEKELSIVNMEIFKEQQKIEKLIVEMKELKESAFLNTKQKASEVQTRRNYENYIEALIEERRKEIIKLEKKKDDVIKELAEKKKEIKIFDSLKEKHLLNYIKEENKIELNLLDEIAGKKNKEEPL